MNPQIPTGNTTKIVQQYYEYLLSRHLLDIKLDRATKIFWNPLFLIWGWAVILIAFFFLLAYSLNKSHRLHGELYQNVSYAGALTERNGSGSLFNWAIIVGLFIYVFYFGYMNVLYGFPY